MNNEFDVNQQPREEQIVYAQNVEKETSALTTAIVSAAFTCSFYLSIVGLILAIVTKGKIKDISLTNPIPSGRIVAAKIISNISLGFSIACTAVVTMYFIVVLLMFILYGSIYGGMLWGLANY